MTAIANKMPMYPGPSDALMAAHVWQSTSGAARGLLFAARPDAAPDVIFIHANGFCAATYAVFLAQLHQHSGANILALDLRGFGSNHAAQPATQIADWQIFADDVTATLADMKRPVILMGHSMGGVIAMLAAAISPQHVRAYVGYDPVILPRLVRWGVRLPGGVARLMAHFKPAQRALHRRASFPSRAAAFQAWRGRGGLKRWDDACLADYCEGGLRPDNMGVSLCCNPAWEANCYAAQGSDTARALRHLACPAHILYPQYGAVLMGWARRKLVKRGAQVTMAPNCGHLMLMEQPERFAQWCATTIQTYLSPQT